MLELNQFMISNNFIEGTTLDTIDYHHSYISTIIKCPLAFQPVVSVPSTQPVLCSVQLDLAS